MTLKTLNTPTANLGVFEEQNSTWHTLILVERPAEMASKHFKDIFCATREDTMKQRMEVPTKKIRELS